MNNLENLNGEIKKQNEDFAKMTKPQQRVIIASDCIIRIEANQIIPRAGSIVNKDTIRGSMYKHNIADLKTLLEGDIERCTACAKGGLFLSCVGRVNKFNVAQLDGTNSQRGAEHLKLLEFFTVKQLAVIEMAFEGGQYIGNNEYWDKGSSIVRLTERDKQRARNFYTKYMNEPEERLLAICRNIVKNGGTFKL